MPLEDNFSLLGPRSSYEDGDLGRLVGSTLVAGGASGAGNGGLESAAAARIRDPFRDPQSWDRTITRVRADLARYQSLIS